jgi:CheY-like chemotaxis protein
MTLGLSQRGYDTEPCENGVCALKKLESYMKNNINLDAIVVDIRLPDIDGIKLAKIIKFKYPGIPIILIIGYADRYNQEEIRDLRVHAFLEKPFTPDELTEQFVQILKNRQDQEEKAAIVEGKVEAKSESAYMLLKLEEKANFFETYRTLYYMKDVLYCDATKGDYDLFLLVQSDSMENLKEICENQIKKVKGIQSIDFLEVGRPVLDDSTTSIIQVVEDALSDESKVRNMGHRVCSYQLKRHSRLSPKSSIARNEVQE